MFKGFLERVIRLKEVRSHGILVQRRALFIPI